MYLFQREKKLLALLCALSKPVLPTDFQRLLFLFCASEQVTTKERTMSSTYDFVPYKYGAFSFTSYHDRSRLEDKGLLKKTDDLWELTKTGQEISQGFVPDHVYSFVNQFNQIRGSKLIAESYRRHPYSAINSEIIDDVLESDPITRQRVQESVPKIEGEGIFTIGYQERSLETYVNLLIKNNVNWLFDVRHNPVSRRYGFSKRTLSSICSKFGVVYQHLPQLGISSQDRQKIHEKQNYDAVFTHYRQRVLPEKQQWLDLIRNRIMDGTNLVLTCYERNFEHCHRSALITCVVQSLDRHDVVRHL